MNTNKYLTNKILFITLRTSNTMKKLFSTMIFASLFALAIPPSVEAHKVVESYKECTKYAKKLGMTCEEAIADGLILIMS